MAGVVSFGIAFTVVCLVSGNCQWWRSALHWGVAVKFEHTSWLARWQAQASSRLRATTFITLSINNNIQWHPTTPPTTHKTTKQKHQTNRSHLCTPRFVASLVAGQHVTNSESHHHRSSGHALEAQKRASCWDTPAHHPSARTAQRCAHYCLVAPAEQPVRGLTEGFTHKLWGLAVHAPDGRRHTPEGWRGPPNAHTWPTPAASAGGSR